MSNLKKFTESQIQLFKAYRQYQPIFQQYHNVLQQYAPAFERIREVQSTLSRIPTNSWSNFIDIDEAIEGHRITMKQLEEGSVKLAKAGWTIPMDLDFGSILDLIEKCAIGEFDEFFFSHYTKDNNKQLNSVLDGILPDDVLTQWTPLLEDCIVAFRHGCYKVTIPCLLSILEGMLAEFINNPKCTNIKEMIVGCKEAKNSENISCIRRLILGSVINFIKSIFATSYFDKERPSIINRHWILHGRDETNWEKIDSIKLFVAIDAMRHVLPEK